MNILDPANIAELYHRHFLLFALGVCAGAFILTYYLIPKITWVVKKKGLREPANERSAHKYATPSFGGVAFFMTFILVMTSLQAASHEVIGVSLIAAVTILFMVGLKDDLIVSTARVKFLGQLVAATFLIFSPALHITNLHGFLGIYAVPDFLGYAFAAFITVGLINAYNLIDGINGLAGIVGFIIASAFALVFYFTDQFFYAVIAGAVGGILLAFLRFNFASLRKRIFMGDSGSLVIGLIFSFLTLRFLAMPTILSGQEESAFMHYRMLFVLAILFIPIFDTARIIVFRSLNKRSVFSPDRNHAHHILLDKGFSHAKASLILGSINAAVILVALGAIVFFSRLALLVHLVILALYAVAWFGFYRAKKSINSATYSSKKQKKRVDNVKSTPEKEVAQ